MPGSMLHLTTSDVERLLRRHAAGIASAFRCEVRDGKLYVTAVGVQVPSSLIPSFDVTFQVTVALAPAQRNVLVAHATVERLPMGLQWIANPFLDDIARALLSEEAKQFVEVRSGSEMWIHLERLPGAAQLVSEMLTITRVRCPAAGGTALGVEFSVETAPPPGGADARA